MESCADPARFSLAHGGKDGHPFPVPLRVYDETIGVMKSEVQRAKLGREEELGALKRLDGARTIRFGSFGRGAYRGRTAASYSYNGRSVEIDGLSQDLKQFHARRWRKQHQKINPE